MIRARLALASITTAALLPGCAFSGLSFVQDERVKIVEPTANATVSLPFEVQWSVEDFDGTFVVFFDRSPMRPDRPLLSLVPDGDPCRVAPDCPGPAWLASRGVYVTAEPALVVDALPDRRSTNRSKDRHELTIVLLDPQGQRVGEAAFVREFIVEREG